MQQRSTAPLIMLWPLLASLAGLAFCAWSAYGNAFQICLSAGCEISKDMAIGGISLWWFGCAAFATLIILSFSGRPMLGVVVAGLFLVADVGLLLLMLMTASCISCLIVALFFALAFTAFRHAGKGYDTIGRSWLVFIWALFLVANLGGVLRETMTPWAMSGPQEPQVNVYFSPTCPSCLQALSSMAPNPTAAFYPVLKKPSEFNLVAHMADAVSEGKNIHEALLYAQSVQEEPKQGLFSSLLLRLRLLFNQAYLARNGISVVPVIEYKGLPAFLSGKGATAYVLPHTEAPDVPTFKQKMPAGSLTVPQGLEPEIFLGNGAFSYTGEGMTPAAQNPEGTAATNPAISSGASNTPKPERMDGTDPAINELFNTGVAGACGGPTTEPCPD